MKKLICLLLAAMILLLTGCTSEVEPPATAEEVDKSELCIVVDPGHGLGDVGALHDENLGAVTEAQINFAIAGSLANELTARGYKVIMTHDGITVPDTEYDDGEETFGPSERADFSNAQSADLFISIHCDSYPASADVYGTRVYYAVDKIHNTKHDKKLAKAVANAVDSAFPDGKDVIVKEMKGADSYTVLYKTNVPAVLVECGFITNKGDAEKLTDAEWQKEFAAALADGVEEYLY